MASAFELDDLFERCSMLFAVLLCNFRVSLLVYHGLPLQYLHSQITAVSLNGILSLFALLVVEALFVLGHLFIATLFWKGALHDPSRRDLHR